MYNNTVEQLWHLYRIVSNSSAEWVCGLRT